MNLELECFLAHSSVMVTYFCIKGRNLKKQIADVCELKFSGAGYVKKMSQTAPATMTIEVYREKQNQKDMLRVKQQKRIKWLCFLLTTSSYPVGFMIHEF